MSVYIYIYNMFLCKYVYTNKWYMHFQRRIYCKAKGVRQLTDASALGARGSCRSFRASAPEASWHCCSVQIWGKNICAPKLQTNMLPFNANLHLNVFHFAGFNYLSFLIHSAQHTHAKSLQCPDPHCTRLVYWQEEKG